MYTGPNIVKSGLVLWLDAANRVSYPGSGTSWRDLSGNNNTGTLTNGPAFSSANLGSISFDGTNDYVITNNNTNVSSSMARTLSCWINLNSTYVSNFYSIIRIGNGATNGALFEILVSTYSASPASFAIVGHFWGGGFALGTPTNVASFNQWCNINMTYSGSTVSIYTNSTLSVTGSFNLSTTNTALNIGQPQFGSHLYNKGLVSNGMLYNRALSTSEVNQNFQALRGRYGV